MHSVEGPEGLAESFGVYLAGLQGTVFVLLSGNQEPDGRGPSQDRPGRW